MFALRSARHLFFTHLYNEGFAADAWSNADSTAVLSFLEETADAMEHSLRGQKEGACSLLSLRLQAHWVIKYLVLLAS